MNTLVIVVAVVEFALLIGLTVKGITLYKADKAAKEKYQVAKAFAAFANAARHLHHEDGIENARLEGWFSSREEAETRYASQQRTLEQRREISRKGILVGKRHLKNVSF